MLGMIFVAGLVWGLLTNPREVLAAWRRERAANRARREYRPAPPTLGPKRSRKKKEPTP